MSIQLYFWSVGVNGNFASKFTNLNVDCFKLLVAEFAFAENNMKIVIYWQHWKLFQIPGDGWYVSVSS